MSFKTDTQNQLFKEQLLEQQRLSRESKSNVLPSLIGYTLNKANSSNVNDAIPVIKTAAQFLKEPQFKNLSRHEKEQFLLGRGLNWSEIELAYKLTHNQQLQKKKFKIDEFLLNELNQLPSLPPRIEYNPNQLTTTQLKQKQSIWYWTYAKFYWFKRIALGSIAIYLIMKFTIIPLLKFFSIRKKRLTDRRDNYKKLYNLCQSQVHFYHQFSHQQNQINPTPAAKEKEAELNELIQLREEGVPKLAKQLKDYKNYLELERGKYTSDYYSKDYWSYSRVPGANVKSEIRSFRGFLLNSKNF